MPGARAPRADTERAGQRHGRPRRAAPGPAIIYDLVTSLLSGLGKASKAGFDVFDVMGHETHEKQLCNALRGC